MPTISKDAEITVIIVSFNTKDITITAIETLLEHAGDVSLRVVVWDNDSQDGSAEAVAERFPDLEVVKHPDNVGFAKANNEAAKGATSDWILLLNSDTEMLPGGVEKLLDFAKQNPGAGIVGGRTVFADGSLNITSCFNRMTIWSLFCAAFGLTYIFPRSTLFNPEAIGSWQRDSVRKVDIITGCWLLARTDLWNELGGFQEKYFMYGEDNDLSLRAGKLGYQPMISPEAQIVHLGGASKVTREKKMVQLARGKATIVHEHWSKPAKPIGLGLLWLWAAVRVAAVKLAGKGSPDQSIWPGVWAKRKHWLAGY